MARTTSTGKRRRAQSDDDEHASGGEQNEANRPIFQNTRHEPICFMFHSSLDAQPGKRRELEAKINANGGMVMETEDNVDTILVSAAMPPEALDRLKMQYACSPNAARRKIYVERCYFINQSIAFRKLEHSLRLPSGGAPVAKPTRRAGRIEFNDDDDWNLAFYIAQRRPDKRSQGRSGNHIYKELEQLGDNQEYDWVNRHTWSSWRERYVKRKGRFNPVIDEIYEHLNGEGNMGRRGSVPASDEEEDIDIEVEEEDEIDSDEEPAQRQQPGRPGSNGRQHASKTRESRPEQRRETFGSSPEHGRTAAADRRDKGKGRAKPSHVHDEVVSDSERDSLFGDHEYGQGVNDDSVLSKPEIRPTQASQGTLVGTPPSSTSTQSKSSHDSINHNAERGPSQVARGKENIGVSEAPPPKATQHRSTKSNTVKGPHRRTRAMPVVDHNPPYRNTRSRSKSVEPLLSHTSADTRSRKNKPTTAVPAMPKIDEVFDDGQSLPAGETMQEEEAVAEQLFDEDQSMAVSEGRDENDQDTEKRMQKTEDKNTTSDIDSDDQQTRDALEGHSSSTADDVFGPLGAVESEPHRQAGRGLRSNIFGSQRAAQVARKLPSRGGAPVSGRPTGTSLTTPVHRQSVRQARAGARTETLFPSPGTRAYKVRKHLEDQAKNAEYVPPAGTRAAALKK